MLQVKLKRYVVSLTIFYDSNIEGNYVRVFLYNFLGKSVSYREKCLLRWIKVYNYIIKLRMNDPYLLFQNGYRFLNDCRTLCNLTISLNKLKYKTISLNIKVNRLH